jgi:hypothetical protein
LKKIRNHEFTEQYFIWALGVSLFVPVVSYLSVSYYDQIIVIWFLLLAMISSLNDNYLNVAAASPNCTHRKYDRVLL